MSILKAVETGYGVNATHHVIESVVFSPTEGTIKVSVSGYADAAAAEVGKIPLMAQSFMFQANALPGIDAASIFATLEAALLETEIFSSTD